MPDLDDLPAIPDGDDEAAGAAALESAIASLDASFALPDVDPDVPEPLGRTPKFDFLAGRFVYSGGSPVYVTGREALKQWVEMAMRTFRGAHEVFSTQFGMDEPEGFIGEAADAKAAVSDWGARFQEAVLQHDRIAAVVEFRATYEPNLTVQIGSETVELGGALVIENFTIVTDEDETTNLGPIAVPVGGTDG